MYDQWECEKILETSKGEMADGGSERSHFLRVRARREEVLILIGVLDGLLRGWKVRSIAPACWGRDMSLRNDSLVSLTSVWVGPGWLGYVRMVEVVGTRYLSTLARRDN